MSRICVFGAGGQLGRRLVEALGARSIPLTRAQLDLDDCAAIGRWLLEARPGAIINASAYTDVEGAEENEALAHRINALAPAAMAEYTHRARIPLIHLSTDYVFSGDKPVPYLETDTPAPLNAYGRSKLAGELAVMQADNAASVVRVSWLYDSVGKNFFNTIRRKACEVEEMRVVADQIGAPSFARDIARALVLLLSARRKEGGVGGLVHMANAGHVSWHGFASAIVDGMRPYEKPRVASILPVTSAEYPTKAQRPKNSRLDTGLLAQRFAITLPSWQDGLSRCMREAYAHH